MTSRYKLTLSYDGHDFHGFQSQPGQRTIQGTVEEILKRMTKGQRSGSSGQAGLMPESTQSGR